jgi:hypothetical protein
VIGRHVGVDRYIRDDNGEAIGVTDKRKQRRVIHAVQGLKVGTDGDVIDKNRNLIAKVNPME